LIDVLCNISETFDDKAVSWFNDAALTLSDDVMTLADRISFHQNFTSEVSMKEREDALLDLAKKCTNSMRRLYERD